MNVPPGGGPFQRPGGFGRRGGFGRGFGGGFGGGIRFGSGVPMTPVVRQLLVANVVMFLLPLLPFLDRPTLNGWLGLVPADVFLGGRVWQLFTYMFLHGGLFHILFNMFLLWMFGTAIEARWGSRDFATYFIVCGLGGALLNWVTGPSSHVPTIGASGAVLGLLVAYAMMYPDRQILIWFLFPVKMKYFIWVLVVIDLLGAFGGQSGGSGTAHWAHLGGMATGFLFLKQDWRLGAFGKKLRAKRARQKMAQQSQRQEKVQMKAKAHQEEIDRILEKISAEGMDSLTEAELKTLREASRH